MSLRDWRISTKDKTHIVYKRKDKTDVVSVHKLLGNEGYVFDMVNKPFSSEKYFKTKSQALKFAKSYMRKH